jgi:hypothetical protein
MRTKTLVLSGVVAALASASLMAQVYSLNSVGYVNVAIPTGFSIISDQLYANGQGVAQTVSPLLDTQVLDNHHAGLTFFKYSNPGGYFVFGVTPGNAWSLDPANSLNAASETTLNPGEAVFVFNPNAATTLTFVGTVPQGTLTVTNYSGFNLISSIVPETGAIDSVLGLTPAHGDTLFFYDSTSYGVVGVTPTGAWTTVTPNTLTPPDGTAPSAPVGGGFFYYANVATGTSENWTRTFNVQ